jgi:hypothetical protein
MKKLIKPTTILAILTATAMLTSCGEGDIDESPDSDTTAAITVESTTPDESENEPIVTGSTVRFDFKHDLKEYSQQAHELPLFLLNVEYTHDNESIIFNEELIYTVDEDDDTITIFDEDGDKLHTFTPINIAKLENEDGDIFTLKDADKQELVLDTRYFLNADVDSIALYFFEGGGIDVEIPEKGDAEFYFETDSDGDVIIEDVEGYFKIVNSYIIEHNGYIFVRY